MAGTPRKRARLTAINGGEEPPKTGWRPARGTPAKTPAASVPTDLDVSDGVGLELALADFTAIPVMSAETHQQFEDLRSRSMAFAQQIMEMPLDPDHKHFAKILSVKQAIATSIFTVTTRVRPGDLRDRDDDGVGALLDEVKARQKKPGDPEDPEEGPSEDDLLN